MTSCPVPCSLRRQSNSQPANCLPALRPRLGARPLALAALALIALSSAAAMPALASDNLGGPVPEHSARPQELRTLLSTSYELETRKAESRRLDPQEKQALRREIREAMRGVYPEQSAGGSPAAKPQLNQGR